MTSKTKSDSLLKQAHVAQSGQSQSEISLLNDGEFRSYRLSTSARLRDNLPPDKQVTVREESRNARCRTGNLLFDGLYAMSLSEARANSVSEISDRAYANGKTIRIEAFQTGELWNYVWTRDLAYSVHLALANFDPQRALNSLLFKASTLKDSVSGGFSKQLVQDTGSGGSYPVSSDRIVWALGAHELLKQFHGSQRTQTLELLYPFLTQTIEQDRRLIYDAADGLYRGEESFLDWREQTYPSWTKSNILPIAMSKALSVNSAYYFLLRSTADYALQLGHADEHRKYQDWAAHLKVSINRNFCDPMTGFYSAFLFSEDGLTTTQTARYDLLANALAILCGIVDEKQARPMLQKYPVAEFGPPVVWPQEKSLPIYHNQGIWPFVTAYWIKAAQKVGYAPAVELGVRSLMHLSATNLSNMENFDFVSGSSNVETASGIEPVINSRRQLWSVAGYMAMVQDVIFGQESSWEGIHFLPFLTTNLIQDFFENADQIELIDFTHQNKKHHVIVHLPKMDGSQPGTCPRDRTLLNGVSIGEAFAKPGDLKTLNLWEIFLGAPKPSADSPELTFVDVKDGESIYAPAAPQWKSVGQGGIDMVGDQIVLSYEHESTEDVTFNIYRDGKLHASNISDLQWTDETSPYDSSQIATYVLQAANRRTGNVSHLTQGRSFRQKSQMLVIPPGSIRCNGTNPAQENHLEKWGATSDELRTDSFCVNDSGSYKIQVEYANGSAPTDMGLTCAVKKLEIREADLGPVLSFTYLVMPHTGSWEERSLSSAVTAKLFASKAYEIRILEDEYCRNMSYLKTNELYTAFPGGGKQSQNITSIFAIQVLYCSATATKASQGCPSPPAAP